MQATFLSYALLPGDRLTYHRKQNIHRDTDGDHRHRVHQTHDDEELGTQRRDEFRLARHALETELRALERGAPVSVTVMVSPGAI